MWNNKAARADQNWRLCLCTQVQQQRTQESYSEIWARLCVHQSEAPVTEILQLGNLRQPRMR